MSLIISANTRINIDSRINEIENNLSEYAWIPFIPGSVKTAGGIIQASIALACAILTYFPSRHHNEWSLNQYAWTHVKHGLGNLIAGLFEAIPLVGFGVSQVRELKKFIRYRPACQVWTGHERKFMAYASLEAKDISFESPMGHEKAANNKYGAILPPNANDEMKIKMAAEAVKGFQ